MRELSPVATVVMCIVIVACLAFFLIMVYRASLQPGTRRPRRERMLTGVRGGTHVAVGGRSVAPDRDAAVAPLREPEPETEPTVPGVPASRSPHDAEATAPGAPVPTQRAGHADRASRAKTEQGG